MKIQKIVTKEEFPFGASVSQIYYGNEDANVILEIFAFSSDPSSNDAALAMRVDNILGPDSTIDSSLFKPSMIRLLRSLLIVNKKGEIRLYISENGADFFEALEEFERERDAIKQSIEQRGDLKIGLPESAALEFMNTSGKATAPLRNSLSWATRSKMRVRSRFE